VDEALSALTGFVNDGIEPLGFVTRELYGEVHNAEVRGENWEVRAAGSG
jgi:hypothetical protein